MTWQNQPSPNPWHPIPPPRLVNRGIQGGTWTLDQAPGQWKPALKLESKCPDMPSSESNDHFRTIYVQATRGPLATIGEDFLCLGIVLRFRFGIGNGQMKTIYDVIPNGIIHAAVVGESVEVDAATVQTFFRGDFVSELTPENVNEPTPIPAGVPPTITIGVIQNQSLAMNPIATPKRSFNVTTPGTVAGLARHVPIPAGAQSITIVGDPTKLAAVQIFDPTESAGIALPINVETTLVPGAWLVNVDSIPGGADDVCSVVFGLGI
jgi:hypothetical protein